jgi:hypothetical protein
MGSMMTSQLGADIGAFKPFRAIKKVGKGVAKGAKIVGKGVVAVHMIPIKLAIKAVVKLALPLSRVLCKAPRAVLKTGSTAAGVSPDTVPLFCTAVAVRNMSQVRKLLPKMLKVAVKIAAVGAFPPIAAPLAVIRRVPGLKLVPGLKFLAGSPAWDDSELLGDALEATDDEVLLGALNPIGTAAGVTIGVSALAAASGLWLALRR